ncbi:TIM barrel protein [Cohnella lubricantis]|uniref:TIM barrel protein n=1 Tax=Cohnella lubricantis TaxID=2163172 RepID=A0A841TCX0_9BACL|nr:TIM barrel protein [Cohnella lubricantis]MBB6677849.1 TIM barrel protein [Cohnella lubricantis]MBP2119028.1 sugar phosphate isomerase/epimerase [Cohnella lubricantis]
MLKLENRLSISSWSLHRCLGPLRWTVWDNEAQNQRMEEESQPAMFELLELPKLAREHGLSYLELCHFHFPSRDESYLRELRQAFDDTGVSFHTMLVDYGDISSPDPVRRASDIHYLKGWIEAAAVAGASAVRIVAGEQSGDDPHAIARSADALRELRQYASGAGVEVVTENFRELTGSSVHNWSQVVERAGAADGFRTIVDFGNLPPQEKEQGVRYGAPRAHSIHAKPSYAADGTLLAEAFLAQLRIAEQLKCEAPVSIIFDRDGDMWEGIERIKRVILQSQP